MSLKETSNPELTIILEQIDKTQKSIIELSTKFFENQVKFDSNFDESTKNLLKENMKLICKTKHDISIQKQAMQKVEEKFNDVIPKLNETDKFNFDQLISKINFDKELEENIQQLSNQNKFVVEKHEAYNNLINLIESDENQRGTDDENDSAQMEEDFQIVQNNFTIPIDPISLAEINIPIRNKKCNHLYDKENFLKLVKNSGFIKCPVAGCTNRVVRSADVEEDSRLRILIEKARGQE